MPVDELADALLDSDPAAARTFSLRAEIGESMFDNEDTQWLLESAGVTEEIVDSWFRQTLPRVSDEPADGHRRGLKPSSKSRGAQGEFRSLLL
jgi:hypothetical protein